MIREQEEQVSFADLGLWSGKMCLEATPQTAVRTSEPSLKKQRKSQTPKFLFLDLREASGLTQGALWEEGTASLGEPSTLNILEFPSVAVESHLSQILEANPHPKYFLSPRACKGILNRAERRGKELPEMLKEALMRQSASKNEQDVRGGTKASSSSTIEQEHSAHSTINQCYSIDQGAGKSVCDIKNELSPTLACTHDGAPAVCYGISAYESNSMKSSNPHSGIYEADTSRTLDNNGGNPACNQGGMAIVHLDTMHDQQAVMTYGLDRAAYTQGKNAKYNFSVEEEKIGTQTAKGPGAVCTEKGELYETETRNPILRLLWETYGAQAVVKWGIGVLDALQQTEILRQGMYESSVSSKTENRDVLGGNTPICPSIVAEWLLRDMREQQENGSTSQRRQSSEQQHRQFDESMPELPQQTPQTCEKMFDMWSKGKGLRLLRQTLSEIQEIWESANGERQSAYTYSLVRRLTPLEAERLQGYPDYWTHIGDWTDSKGKKHKDADSPKYKALGNSIAVPCWRFILRNINEYCTEHTMASFFDGIAGFCLIWYELGGNIRFVSEIEEYPIAVCKKHFGDEDIGKVGDIENYIKRR